MSWLRVDEPAVLPPMLAPPLPLAADLTPAEAGAEALRAMPTMLRELRDSLGTTECRMQAALAEKHRVLSLVARAGEQP